MEACRPRLGCRTRRLIIYGAAYIIADRRPHQQPTRRQYLVDNRVPIGETAATTRLLPCRSVFRRISRLITTPIAGRRPLGASHDPLARPVQVTVYVADTWLAAGSFSALEASLEHNNGITYWPLISKQSRYLFNRNPCSQILLSARSR